MIVCDLCAAPLQRYAARTVEVPGRVVDYCSICHEGALLRAGTADPEAVQREILHHADHAWKHGPVPAWEYR